jgi:putative membrane protein
MAAVAVTGLLTVLAPAFAQNQGSTNAGGPAPGSQGTQGQEHQGHGGTTSQGQGGTMSQGQGKGQGGTMSQQDQKFARDAAADGMMEVELGQLATQKASSQAVKDFGQRMVRDHTQANQQLLQIASQKGLTLSKELPADMRQERDKLSKASGAEFDRMYMSHMLKAHEKDIKEFERESKNAGDPALRSFAEQNLPILRQHLELARSVATQVGADHGSHGSH